MVSGTRPAAYAGTALNSGETALNRTAVMLGGVVAARAAETGGGA
jgi:hypothetical protein